MADSTYCDCDRDDAVDMEIHDVSFTRFSEMLYLQTLKFYVQYNYSEPCKTAFCE